MGVEKEPRRLLSPEYKFIGRSEEAELLEVPQGGLFANARDSALPDLRRRELQQKLREIWSARMFGCAKGRADRDRRDGNPGVARYDVSRGPSRPAQRARSYLR